MRSLQLLRDFEHQARPIRLAVVLVAFVVIVIADFATGSDITLRALYLGPIALGAWAVGGSTGVVLSFASVGISLYFDVYSSLHMRPRFVLSDGALRLAVYLSTTFLLRKLHQAHDRLDELAVTDPLTGLYNRRGFGEEARRELLHAQRERTPMSLLAIDLDGFKEVNDRLGHAAGDAVLVAVARVLGAGRATDVVARLGGDEFAILLPATTTTAAHEVVDRIRERLMQAMQTGAWPVTFSIGVVTFADGPTTLAAMLEAADALMYEAKRGGGHDARYREIAATTP